MAVFASRNNDCLGNAFPGAAQTYFGDSMKKNTLWLFVLAIILVFSACAPATDTSLEPTATPFPTPVRKTFTVQRGDITVEAKLAGYVAAQARDTVYFAMNGTVSDVYVKPGDKVTAGQLLGQLRELKELQAVATNTRTEIRRAEIALEIEQLLLEKYKKENEPAYDIKIQELEVEIARLALNDVLAKFGIDPTSGKLDELDAAVAQAKAFALADGTVLSTVTVGRSINTTTIAFVIGDSDQLEIIAELDASKGDEQVREMFEGMEVTVALNANPDQPLTGKIRQLPSPFGTGNSIDRTVHIILDKKPSEAGYKIGDKLSTRIVLASKTGVLWLPPDAVRQTGGRTFVIINGPSGPKRLDIEIGLRTRDMIEIVSGLDEGQVVIGQ